MKPIVFHQANCRYGPPPELTESQCKTIHAYHGQALAGSVDGSSMVVVAWLPEEEDLERLKKGLPVFLTVMGGLPPHFLTTSFEEAINPA